MVPKVAHNTERARVRFSGAMLCNCNCNCRVPLGTPSGVHMESISDNEAHMEFMKIPCHVHSGIRNVPH
jgi:hypothetical protein